MSKQNVIALICDRCTDKAIFTSTKDDTYLKWGTFSAKIHDGSWQAGRIHGADRGKTSHICPECIGTLKKWWKLHRA